jgi:hypothetical protein
MLVDLAAAGQRRLTLSEAEQLARAALTAETSGFQSLSLQPPPIPPKKGAMFNVVSANSAPGSVHLHALLVDIDTAEVWEPERCEPVTTLALETSQRKIRRQIKISIAEVNRALVLARENGCSNLVDERSKPADFSLWRLAGFSTNEKRTLYRYLITADDVSCIGVSLVPIKIREGSKIKFYRTSASMYVIDDDGSMQELYDERDFVPPPKPKR